MLQVWPSKDLKSGSCWRFTEIFRPDLCGQLQEHGISAPRNLQPPTTPFRHLAFKNTLQVWFGELEIFWGHGPLFSLHGPAVNLSLLHTPIFWGFLTSLGMWTCAKTYKKRTFGCRDTPGMSTQGTVRVRSRQKMAICKPGRETSGDPESADTLPLDFQPPEW